MIVALATAALTLAANQIDEEATYAYVPIPDASDTNNLVTTVDHSIKYTVDMQLVGQGQRCYCGWDDYQFFEPLTSMQFKAMQFAYLDMCEQTTFPNQQGQTPLNPTWDQLTNTWNLRSPNSVNTSVFCSAGRPEGQTQPHLTQDEAIARCAAEPQCHGFQRTKVSTDLPDGTRIDYTLEEMINERVPTKFYNLQPTGTDGNQCNFGIAPNPGLQDKINNPSQCYRKQKVTATAMKRIDSGSGLGFRDVYINPDENENSFKHERNTTIAFALIGSFFTFVYLAAFVKFVKDGRRGNFGGSYTQVARNLLL